MNYVSIDSDGGDSLKLPEFVTFPVRNGRIANSISVAAETSSGQLVDITIDLVMGQPIDELGGWYLPVTTNRQRQKKRLSLLSRLKLVWAWILGFHILARED